MLAIVIPKETTMDRRHNWKSEISTVAKLRAAQRETLLVQKELLSQEIHSLTMAEIRSDKYVQLKRQEAELVAKLAAL
jgi:hypothetical protein